MNNKNNLNNLIKKNIIRKLFFLATLLLFGFGVEYFITRHNSQITSNTLTDDNETFKILYLGDSIASMNYNHLIKTIERKISSKKLPFNKYKIIPFFKENYKVADFNQVIDKILANLHPHLVFSMIGSIDLRNHGDFKKTDSLLLKLINKTEQFKNDNIISNLNFLTTFTNLFRAQKFNSALNVINKYLQTKISTQEINVILSVFRIIQSTPIPFNKALHITFLQINKKIEYKIATRIKNLSEKIRDNSFILSHERLRNEITNLYELYYLTKGEDINQKLINNKKINEDIALKLSNESFWSWVYTIKLSQGNSLQRITKKTCTNFCELKHDNFAINSYIHHHKQSLKVIKIASMFYKYFYKNNLMSFYTKLQQNEEAAKLKIPSPLLLSILVSIYNDKSNISKINEMKAYEVNFLAGLYIHFSIKIIHELSIDVKSSHFLLNEKSLIKELKNHYPRLNRYFTGGSNSIGDDSETRNPVILSIIKPYQEMQAKLLNKHAHLVVIRYPGSTNNTFNLMKELSNTTYIDSNQLNQQIKLKGRSTIIQDIVTSEIGHLTIEASMMLAEIMVKSLQNLSLMDYKFMKFNPKQTEINGFISKNEM